LDPIAVRNSSTNGSPMPPTPGGSPVPRANTASTSGHGCADETGIGAPNDPPSITSAAKRTRSIWLRDMNPILA
jgi:hypothetical protein